MNNSSAVSIAGAINEAIANNATLGDYEAATSSGNVVTIKSTFGQAITVDSFSSVGAGTATYSTIAGGTGSDAVVILVALQPTQAKSLTQLLPTPTTLQVLLQHQAPLPCLC